MGEAGKTSFRDHVIDVAKVIEGAFVHDLPKVQAYASRLAEKLLASGEVDCAKRIQQALGKAPVSTLSLAKGQPTFSGPRIPADSESRVPMADEERPQKGEIHLVLPAPTMGSIRQFITYFEHADRLAARGLAASSSMILCGPPGCGKTHAARYIAAEVNLPLITARADGLISSYLGSTAKNLRALFEHAASRPCVLFLDEFDAIAKMRDDDRELGELKRVVISLLQNIDAMGREHVLLAATNHEHLLDPAVWRRFTYRLKFCEPAREARAEMLRTFFGTFATDDLVEAVADASEGMTGASLRQVAEDCMRAAVVAQDNTIAPSNALRKVLSVRGDAASEDEQDLIVRLRNLNPKQFTQSKLAKMFGVTQPRVSQILSSKRG